MYLELVALNNGGRPSSVSRCSAIDPIAICRDFPALVRSSKEHRLNAATATYTGLHTSRSWCLLINISIIWQKIPTHLCNNGLSAYQSAVLSLAPKLSKS